MILPWKQPQKSEREQKMEEELERLKQLDFLVSDANPRISIERKKKITTLKKRLGKASFSERFHQFFKSTGR